MHIGIDATCWHNKRGYGRHARSLLRALVKCDTDNQYTFVLDAPPNGEPLPDGVECRLVTASAPTAVAAASNGHRSLRDMWRMSRALSAAEFDVLVFPTVYSYVPVWSRAKKVVLIHDIIAEKYPQLTLPNRMSRIFWKTKVALGRRQADALVTVSEYSRQSMVEYFRVSPAQVHVVGEAGDPVFRVLDDATPTPRLKELALGDDSRSIVYIGGFSPHKNLETLIAAFRQIASCDDLNDAKLVLVGEYQKEVFHSYYSTIRDLVDQWGLSQRVVFTGFLPDDELVVLLNRATVLALPSLLEGYGLPAVEAAACGCPVVATTASPLPQLLGDGGIFLDPMDHFGWRRALQDVLRLPNLRQRMREAGLAAAGKLSWELAAQQMKSVLNNVRNGAANPAHQTPSTSHSRGRNGTVQW